LISIDEYFTFFLVMAFVLGITFEVPIIMGFLSQAKIVQSETFQKQFRFFILFAFILAAILTPPDAVTQTLVAIPMILLYQVGIVLARYLEGKSKSKKSILLIAGIPLLLGGSVYYVSFSVFQPSPLNTSSIEDTVARLFLEETTPLISEETLLLFILEATKDPQPTTRLSALKKIRTLSIESKEKIFRQALQDPDFGVFWFACFVLKEDFNSKESLLPLVEFLQSSAYPQRCLAFALLTRWNPNSFGYDPSKSPDLQKESLQKWRDWGKK
ncbi:MAG: twin-arginine translocase subunit TatC, partial [Planctomycetota bacterium]